MTMDTFHCDGCGGFAAEEHTVCCPFCGGKNVHLCGGRKAAKVAKSYDPNCVKCRYSRPGSTQTHRDHVSAA